MKNAYIIGIVIIAFTSCNANFLRNLAPATVTLKSVTFPTYCGTNVPAGYSFSLLLTVPDGSAIAAATTTKLPLSEKEKSDTTLATSCKIEAKTASGADADANVSCETTAAGTAGKIYVLATPSANIVEGETTITAWTKKTNEVVVNPNYLALGKQTTEQKFDYSQEGTKAFTIKYSGDLTEAKKPSVVKAGETEITGCTIGETDKTVLSCPITSSTVKVVDNKETSYPIKVTDACNTEVDTGITVKVSSTSTSSSFFNQFSKIALIAFGIFLF